MFNKERKTKYAIRKLAVATVSLAIGSVVAVPNSKCGTSSTCRGARRG